MELVQFNWSFESLTLGIFSSFTLPNYNILASFSLSVLCSDLPVATYSTGEVTSVSSNTARNKLHKKQQLFLGYLA